MREMPYSFVYTHLVTDGGQSRAMIWTSVAFSTVGRFNSTPPLMYTVCQVAARLEAVAARLEAGGVVMAAGGGAPATGGGGGAPPSVNDFQALLDNQMAAFLACSNGVSTPTSELHAAAYYCPCRLAEKLQSRLAR